MPTQISPVTQINSLMTCLQIWTAQHNNMGEFWKMITYATRLCESPTGFSMADNSKWHHSCLINAGLFFIVGWFASHPLFLYSGRMQWFCIVNHWGNQYEDGDFILRFVPQLTSASQCQRTCTAHLTRPPFVQQPITQRRLNKTARVAAVMSFILVCHSCDNFISLRCTGDSRWQRKASEKRGSHHFQQKSRDLLSLL